MDAEVLALLQLDSADARKHARCGPKAACRRAALKRCDEDLDALLESMAMQPMRDMGASPEHGAAVL